MTELDTAALFSKGLGAFWWALPLAVLWLIVETSWFKGRLGEFLVARSLEKLLDPASYTILHDVTLPVHGGTAQIDHIVISTFGVFVVETKNMSGWIFASQNNKHWTQTFHRKKFKFQNPLRQNYKHLKAVSLATGLPETKLRSIVVFTGAAKFKTTMPENVTRRGDGVRYIRRHQETLLSASEVEAALEALRANSLERGSATNRTHVRNLKRQNEQPLCSLCGSKMVKRMARKGPQAGNKFWGCSAFPRCKGTRPLS